MDRFSMFDLVSYIAWWVSPIAFFSRCRRQSWTTSYDSRTDTDELERMLLDLIVFSCFLISFGIVENQEEPKPTPKPQSLSELASKTRLRRPGAEDSGPTPSMVLSDKDVKVQGGKSSTDKGAGSLRADHDKRLVSITESKCAEIADLKIRINENERALQTLQEKSKRGLAEFYSEDNRDYRERVLRKSLEGMLEQRRLLESEVEALQVALARIEKKPQELSRIATEK
jgi:hypothetical protein